MEDAQRHVARGLHAQTVRAPAPPPKRPAETPTTKTPALPRTRGGGDSHPLPWERSGSHFGRRPGNFL